MAKYKKSKSSPNSTVEETLPLHGVDTNISLYDLTDLFYSAHQYHETSHLVDMQQVSSFNPETSKLEYSQITLTRFRALRKVNASHLGSRPYLSGKGAVLTKPNISLGYLKQFLTYITLPMKSFFIDGDIVKIQIDRRLRDDENMSDQEKEDSQVMRANNDNLADNMTVSSITTRCFVDLLKISRRFTKCKEQSPIRVCIDGMIAYLHPDPSLDWDPEPIHALDLITEPQCGWDTSEWSWFFVIRKMSASEVLTHIREKTPFWDHEALRWALHSAAEGKSLLGNNASSHSYGSLSSREDGLCGESFMVQSFYKDKEQRETNINSYYGNMLVVEGYYTNDEGKVDKVIFFPSAELQGQSELQRTLISKIRSSKLQKGDKEYDEFPGAEDMKGANVLFFRSNVYDSISDALTVIPYDRSEPSLERQRPPSFELYPMLELASRLDCSIFNLALIMGIPMVNDLGEGTDSRSLEEISLDLDGQIVNIGNRAFVNAHFKSDLTSMIAVRNMILQHAASKAFLGGLDGGDTKGEGRGFELASLRLSRDGRVYKHIVEDFSMGVRDALVKCFRSILDFSSDYTKAPVLVSKKFYSVIHKLNGHNLNIFSYDKKDILPDTNLPYWINLDTVRVGASHFGAAEQLIYSTIKNTWGDVLDQKSHQKLSRQAIQGMLGTESAIDILGDPRDNLTVDADQVYRARSENAAIMGSVDQGAMLYEEIPILQVKDDHLLHLTEVHNPLLKQMIDIINQGEADAGTQNIETLPEDVINTRVDIILKISAVANHVMQHQEALNAFGEGRRDVNQVKEETNQLLQAAEGLLHSLQVHLRALQQKRQEKEQKLAGMSPENEIEKEKIEIQRQELQYKAQVDGAKLDLANRLKEDRMKQHMDKQVSRARDRNLKREIAVDNSMTKQTDLQIKATATANKAASTPTE